MRTISAADLSGLGVPADRVGMSPPTSRRGGPIDVVLAADARFSVPLAVVIASLADANRRQVGGPDRYRVTIFAEDFPAKVRDLVRAAGDEHLEIGSTNDCRNDPDLTTQRS